MDLVERLAEQLCVEDGVPWNIINDAIINDAKDYYIASATRIISGMEDADHKLELVAKKPESEHKLFTRGRPFTIKI